MDNIEVKRIKVKAVVLEDNLESTFTIFTEKKGGPVISSNSLESAKSEFEKAYRTFCAVSNLFVFKDAVKKARESSKTEHISNTVPEIDYCIKQSA